MSRGPVGHLPVATLAQVFRNTGGSPQQALEAVLREPSLYGEDSPHGEAPVLSEKVLACIRIATTSSHVDLREAAQADLFDLSRRNPEAQIEVYRALLRIFKEEKDRSVLENARVVLIGVLVVSGAHSAKDDRLVEEVAAARDSVVAIAGLSQAVPSTPQATPSAPPAGKGMAL